MTENPIVYNTEIVKSIFPNCDSNNKTLTQDEFDYYQLEFLNNNTSDEIVENLLKKYKISPDLVIDTIILIHNDISICNLTSFPYSKFTQMLLNSTFNTLELISNIFSKRKNNDNNKIMHLFINLVYRLNFMTNKENVIKILEILLDLCSSKSIDIFENEEYWGLKGRVGVRTESDMILEELIKNTEIDITEYSDILEQYYYDKDKTLLDFKDKEKIITYLAYFKKLKKYNSYKNSTTNNISTTTNNSTTNNFTTNNSTTYNNISINNNFSTTTNNSTISNNISTSNNIISLNSFTPFFMSNIFEQISGFDNEKITKNYNISKIHNIIFEIIFMLISKNNKIKENFINLVKNVIKSDRKKLVYEKEENPSDSFCFILFHIILNFGKNIFFQNFIKKIDKNVFPTFLFFSINKLMEISILKLYYNIKEKNNSEDNNLENSLFLINYEFDLVQKYLNFVYDLIEERKYEIFYFLIKGSSDNENNIINLNIDVKSRSEENESEGNLSRAEVKGLKGELGRAEGEIGRLEVNRLENKLVRSDDRTSAFNVNKLENGVKEISFKSDIKNQNNTSNSICSYEFITDYNKEIELINSKNEDDFMSVGDIAIDESFLNVILQIQSLCIKNMSKSIITLISLIFKYKNILKMECINILLKMKKEGNLVLSGELTKDLLLHYCNKSVDNLVEVQYAINQILEDEVLDKFDHYSLNDCLRVVSIALGSFEDKISKIFTSIDKINIYIKKDVNLNYHLENDEISVSDDEEVYATIDDKVLEYFCNMSDSFLDIFIRDKILKNYDEKYWDSVKSDIKAQVRYFKNKKKFKIYKKIKINEKRKKLNEDILESSSLVLNNLLDYFLKFLKNNSILFYNKNIFLRINLILNSSLNLLVGKNSEKIKLFKKYENFDPKSFLRKILLIFILIYYDFCKYDKKLGVSNLISTELLLCAIELAECKYLLNEKEIKSLKEILAYIEKTNINENNKSNSDIECEMPEEFVDPLTYSVMKDPVILLTSKITVDRNTFKQIMLNDQIDPFSRMPLDETKIQDNVELKEKIKNFMNKRG